MNLVTLSATHSNDQCNPEANPSSKLELNDAAIYQGSTLTGQAKIEFELMLSCAIFDEPKCQNCLAKGKRLNPGHC